MTSQSTRRSFLGHSAAIGAALWVGGQRSAKALSPMQSLTAASIGVGGKGDSDAKHIYELGVQMVGICDIDRGRLNKKARSLGKDPDIADDMKGFGYSDYRDMLDALGDKVDIVTVSTPDHNHACAAVKAMKMKKHVYCQKPLTWSIYEARLMRTLAAETGVVTQMGNQGTSENGLREAVEVVRSGAIGDVSEVHIWSNRPVWPQGIGRPKGEDPVPDYINWDAWIGPAPMRPYKEGVYHGFNWRGWVDFGTGALGDMACHTTNMPVMALRLWDPIAVTAVKNPGIYEGETYPASSALMFEFPERDNGSGGKLPACRFYWYDGGELPPMEIQKQLPASFQKRLERQRQDPSKKTSGAVLVGSKGLLFSPDDYGARYFLLPEEDFKGYQPPPQTLPRIPFEGSGDQRQKWEFVQTCLGEYEPGTMSNFGYAGRLTETILVGNLAIRSQEGKRIEWDAKNMRSTNMPEINQFTHRKYREGWTL